MPRKQGDCQGSAKRAALVLMMSVGIAIAASELPASAGTTPVTAPATQVFRVPATPSGIGSELLPAADTFIDEATPALPAGSTAFLSVQSLSTGNRRSLIRFDLSAYSTSFVVTSAALEFPVQQSASRTIELRRATSAWTEATTWSTAPTVGAVTGSAAGGPSTFSLTVTTDVQAMVTTPAANFGWELRDSVEGALVAVQTQFPGREALAKTTPVLRVSGYLPIVDTLPTLPRAAYGLRKMRNVYAGAAIRVRRSSDNVEQDIGFAANGQVDYTALATFIGANSAFVRTWYDQTGNGFNIVEAINANQPRLVNAGVVDGGVRFTSTINQNLSAAATYGLASNSSWYIATATRLYGVPVLGGAADGNGWYLWDRTTATNDLWGLKTVNSGGARFCLQTRSTTNTNLQCSLSTTVPTTGNSYMVAVERVFGTRFGIYVDGTSEGASVVGAGDLLTPPIMRMGSHSDGAATTSTNADFFEMIVLGYSPTNADRQRIEGSVAWQSGTQGSLPLAHPYRNEKPR